MRNRRERVKRARRDTSGRKLVVRSVLVVLLLLVCCAIPPLVVSAPVGYLALACSVVLLLLDFLYLLTVRRKLDYTASFDVEKCVRKDTALLSLYLTNNGALPMMRLEPVFFMEDSEHAAKHEKVTSAVLNRHETMEFNLELSFDHIGIYEAGVSRVRLFDPLGLFFVTIRKPVSAQVVVEPQISDVHLENLDRVVMTQSLRMAKPTSSDDMDYACVRSYSIGDPMKSIHWKLSARSRELMTRLFEAYTNPNVAIVLDMRAPQLEADERLDVNDALVESALSLEKAARMQNMDTALYCCDAQGGVRVYHMGALTTGDIDTRELIAALPMPGPDVDANACIDEVERQTQNPNARSTALIYCTAAFSDDISGALVALRGATGNPALVMACPNGQEDAYKQRYRGQIARFEDADIPCEVVSQAAELEIG